MIRQDRLEEQLLSYLQEQVLTSRMVDYAVQQFEVALQQRLAEIQQNAARNSEAAQKLQEQRVTLEEKAARIVAAITEAGHSPILLHSLKVVEQEIASIQRELDAQKAPSLGAGVADLRKFVTGNIADIRTLLLEVPSKAKQQLMKHVNALTLTPRRTPSGPVYDVTGQWNLMPEECVIELVARDGIEPPTPAFSGLRSPITKASHCQSPWI